MANKYIRHGETYCGDGTTPDAATSNGGVGALNSMIYFEGTAWPSPAVLAAGDTVFIRSLDAAGAAIKRTLAAAVTLGSAAGTAVAWVRWVIDAGTVWAGINGVITYTNASTYTCTLRTYNYYQAGARYGLKIANTGTSAGVNPITKPASGMCTLENTLIDCSEMYGSGTAGMGSAVGQCDFVGCKFSFFRLSTLAFYINTNLEQLNFYNCKIEILNLGGSALFIANDNLFVNMVGGEIYGAGATSGSMYLCAISANASYRASVRLVGTKYPVNMQLAARASYFNQYATTGPQRLFEAVLCDSLFGSEIHSSSAIISSRNDGNFPTLNATLPDEANTPWSWYADPRNCSVSNSIILNSSEFYSDTAATKAVTLEFLLSTTFTGANKSNVFITVEYTEVGGAKNLISSFDPLAASMDASSAAWSATTYGAISFNKKMLSVTTPTAIAQNSNVLVTLHCSKPPASVTDIFFVCPDVVIS